MNFDYYTAYKEFVIDLCYILHIVMPDFWKSL